MSLAFNEPKYQIQTSTFRCTGCEQEVVAGTTYYTAVVYQDEAFQRRDSCAACWRGPVEGVYAFWKTRRPAPAEPDSRKVRFDTALIFDFFRRLGDPPGQEGPSEAEREELRFVLSLLLVRKKVLLFSSSYQEAGVETLKLTEKEDVSRVHWVKNPELTDAQLERVKDRIGELLQMQL